VTYEHHDSKPVEAYVGLLERVLDEKGIHPHGMGFPLKGDGVEVFYLATGPGESAQFFWQVVGMAAPDKIRKDVLWGWDMVTLPGQGTEFADAYVFVHWTRVPGMKLASREAFRVGVINYQHEPRIVRPVDWDNEYWTNWALEFLAHNHPPFLMNFLLKWESPPGSVEPKREQEEK